MYFDHDVEMGSVDDDGAEEWEDDSNNEGLTALPPREEGFLQSHAGGEAIFHRILKDCQPKYACLSFSFAADCNIGQKME